jgi:hypothetical protein
MIAMDWVKRNWIATTIGIVVIAIIIYYARKKRTDGKVVITLPKMPKLSDIPKLPYFSKGATAPSGETPMTVAQLQKQYDDCMERSQNWRGSAGTTHPCSAFKDLLDKGSRYVARPNNPSRGPGLVNFVTGNQGLLEDMRMRSTESSFLVTGCPPETEPNPVTGICGNTYSWDQVPKGIYGDSNYVGDFSEADWLRLKKFATGNQGLKLLEDNSFVGAFSETKGLNLTDFAMGLQGTSLLLDKEM